MLDIEDITTASHRKKPYNALHQSKLDEPGNEPENSIADLESDLFLPGKAVIYCNTWGCSHNTSDSEYMLGLLKSQGYCMTDNKSAADLWLLNSCTVKNPSETTFKNEIKEAENLGKKIVLAGCVTQADPMSYSLNIIGVNQIHKIVEVVEQTLQGRKIQLLSMEGHNNLNLPKIRKNKFIEIIPINVGCLNQCTYCKTKHARGNLSSYSVDEIVGRCKDVLREGVVEIWLTSEDTGTYGRDIGSSIIELLQAIEKVIPNEGVMVRLGMTNPPYILEHLDSIARLLNSPKFYSFLHIPIQSGNNRILDLMKREYTRQDFEKIVSHLLQYTPNISISTDIICGFPTETELEFQDSLDIINRFKFPFVHISQFYGRPGTPALRMPKVPSQVIKDRSRKLTKLFNSYSNEKDLIGMVFERVLITDWATLNEKPALLGHNKYYQQILISVKHKGKKSNTHIGKMVTVRIIRSTKWHLEAEIINFTDYQDIAFLSSMFFICGPVFIILAAYLTAQVQ
eukprot:NODE_41_length_34096_cov_2.002235.p6 type:complete len:512 gc:universal NODE_41_length_34096_cov_2.002235:10688-9153(-)